MRRLFSGLLVLSFTAPASNGPALSQVATVPSYKVSASLFDDGKLIGQPTITLREGQPAKIMVSSGPGYSLRILARELPVSRRFGRRIIVRSDIALRHMNKWTPVSSPSLTIPIGTRVSYELKATARKDKSTVHPFRIEMTITDSASI